MTSGGIDSPVAAHRVLEKGFDIVPVYCDNCPFTDEEDRTKALDLIDRLGELHPGQVGAPYIIEHGRNLVEIAEKTERKLACILCKRMMFRIASKLADSENAVGIITGENLGQVASQTLPNLTVTSRASKYPILRPLISFDKNDTVAIARRIGTFEISTRPAANCRLAPDRPETKARLKAVEREEAKVDIERLVHESVKNARRVGNSSDKKLVF